MSIQSYIAENKLEWMTVYNGKTDSFKYAYRGSLVVTEGKVISPDKSLPPKEILKQALLSTNSDAIDFLACELETINVFERFFERYKAYLTPSGKYVLFISDVMDKGKFVYEGVTFYTYPLVESSVWNELLDFADLPKSDLKKMSDSEKIDAVCSEMLKTTLRLSDSTLDAIKASQTKEGKLSFGAV